MKKIKKNLDTGFFMPYNFLLGFEAVSNRFLVDYREVSKKAPCGTILQTTNTSFFLIYFIKLISIGLKIELKCN